MADALVLLVTASIFLSGFLSVRIHQDLDRATDATESFDRRVRRWRGTFREVDTDKAVAPFIELAAGLRPDPVLRFTAAANGVFAACVAAVVAYWAIRPAGDDEPARWVVGGAAVLVQVVVVALFEYDRKQVSGAFRGQLAGACDSVVHLAPYLFAPHSVQPATTLTQKEGIRGAIESLDSAARHNSRRVFLRRRPDTSSAADAELALVRRWLHLMIEPSERPSPAPHDEQRERPTDGCQLGLRIAGHLLDATEAKHRGSRLYLGMDASDHLVVAARVWHEFDSSLDGVAWDAVCWALITENCGAWDSAHHSVGVFIATGETAGTEQAAMGMHSILGEYLAGRRTSEEVEAQLRAIRNPKTGDAPSKRYRTLLGAVRMWVKMEMRLADDGHNPVRRVRALLLAEELGSRDPAAGDVDVDRELRGLGADDDAHVAERMWLHLLRGQVAEATDLAKEMEPNPMNSVLVEQPLMTLAWAWLHFQSGRGRSAETLLTQFVSSSHVVHGHTDLSSETICRLQKVLARHGVSNESFREFSARVKQTHAEEVPLVLSPA